RPGRRLARRRTSRPRPPRALRRCLARPAAARPALAHAPARPEHEPVPARRNGHPSPHARRAGRVAPRGTRVPRHRRARGAARLPIRRHLRAARVARAGGLAPCAARPPLARERRVTLASPARLRYLFPRYGLPLARTA